MSKRESSVLLADMLQAADAILVYVKGHDFSSFCLDRKTVDAVLRNLTVLGEAANRMPVDFIEKHPTVEWGKIACSRHIVVHDYFDVDPEIIWRIVSVYVPELKINLEALIAV